MDALSAIAGSVSNRRGGDMTMGLAAASPSSSPLPSPRGDLSPSSSRGASPSPSSRTPDAATVGTKLNLLYSVYGGSRHAPASQQQVRLGGPRGAALGAAGDYGVGSLAVIGTPPAEMDPGNATPRSLGSENGAIASHAEMEIMEMEMVESTEAMLLEVKDLPRKGTPVSILAKELRCVLDRNELILDEHTREKAAQWSGSIYRSALVLTTRIDHSRTTLGLVLTDDTVETVLPGGPAFMAGLRQGDAIAKVSTWCSNPFCGLHCHKDFCLTESTEHIPMS